MVQPAVEPAVATSGGAKRGGAHRHLITGSAVLVVGAAVQALGGSLFWLLAANIDPKPVVGTATALFTSINFVVYVAGLGLPVALARFAVGRSDDADTIFTWSILATIVAAAVIGGAYLGFLAVVRPPSTEPLFHGGFIWKASFVVAVIGAALSMIFDVRCMTIRKWNWVLARISLVALARLPLVWIIRPGTEPQLWLFAWAVIPLAVTGLLGAPLVNRLSGGRLRLRPKPKATSAMIRYSAVNFVSTIGYQAPYFALPVIVLAHVDADTNAAFYVAWGVVSTSCWVPYAIGQALLAEGGKEGTAIQTQVRTALLLAIGIMTIGAVAAWFGSGLITTVYGAQYHDAARILPEMMLAGIPWAISSLYLTEARVLHRHLSTVLITLSLTLAIVFPALWMVPSRGIEGAAHAWLFGNLVGMVVAILAHLFGERLGKAGKSLLSDAITGVDAQPPVADVPQAG
jgi:O-antigen/teichoic acid export membrane protein